MQSLGITLDKLVRFDRNLLEGTGAVSLASVPARLSPHALAIIAHLPFLAIAGILFTYKDAFTSSLLIFHRNKILKIYAPRALPQKG